MNRWFFYGIICLVTPPWSYAKPTSSCFYKIEPGSEHVEWTAFKTSQKIGVTGSFSGVEFTHQKKAETIQGLFESISFKIETEMLQTGLPLRDIKIAKYFFGHMLGEGNITGKVTKFLGQEGKAHAMIEMNKKIEDLFFKLCKIGMHSHLLRI